MVPGDAVDPPDDILEKLRRLRMAEMETGLSARVGRRSSISCSKLPVSAAPPAEAEASILVDIAMTPLGPWLIVIELPVCTHRSRGVVARVVVRRAGLHRVRRGSGQSGRDGLPPLRPRERQNDADSVAAFRAGSQEEARLRWIVTSRSRGRTQHAELAYRQSVARGSTDRLPRLPSRAVG